MQVLPHLQMYTACIGILQNLLLSMGKEGLGYPILHGSGILYPILILLTLLVTKDSTLSRFSVQVFFILRSERYNSPMNSPIICLFSEQTNLPLMLAIQGYLQKIFQVESHSDSSIPTLPVDNHQVGRLQNPESHLQLIFQVITGRKLIFPAKTARLLLDSISLTSVQK